MYYMSGNILLGTAVLFGLSMMKIFQYSVHNTPEKFENGGLTLKTH